MKSINLCYCVLAVLFTASCSACQFPVKKIYAYKQASIPGTIIKNYDENGNEVYKDHKATFSYWFYVEIKNGQEIIPEALWISGKHFKLNTEMISRTPVEKIIYTAATGSETITLVPLTKNKVALIYPTGLVYHPDVKLPNRMKDSELVIGYSWKGKKYFAGVKQITVLEPEANP